MSEVVVDMCSLYIVFYVPLLPARPKGMLDPASWLATGNATRDDYAVSVLTGVSLEDAASYVDFGLLSLWDRNNLCSVPHARSDDGLTIRSLEGRDMGLL